MSLLAAILDHPPLTGLVSHRLGDDRKIIEMPFFGAYPSLGLGRSTLLTQWAVSLSCFLGSSFLIFARCFGFEFKVTSRKNLRSPFAKQFVGKQNGEFRLGEYICSRLTRASSPRLARNMRTPIRVASLHEGARLRRAHQKSKDSHWLPLLFFGGPEGSRTPVRKPLDMTFSECSPLFEIPLARRQRTDCSFG